MRWRRSVSLICSTFFRQTCQTHVPATSICPADTETFQEYYSEGALQPVLITADDLAGYVVEEQIDLDASPVMLVDGEPAGLVTIGLRAHGEAYCRGFGICLCAVYGANTHVSPW